MHIRTLTPSVCLLGSLLFIAGCGDGSTTGAKEPGGACVPAGTLINGECNETPTGTAAGDTGGNGTNPDGNAPAATATDTNPASILAANGMSLAVMWNTETTQGKRTENAMLGSIRVADQQGMRTERAYMTESLPQITASTKFTKSSDTQYDAQGRIRAFIGYGDCAATYRAGITMRFQYDAQGRVASSTMEEYQSHGTTAGQYQGKGEITYTYNADGTIASSNLVWVDENGVKGGSSASTYQYAAAGRTITTTVYDGAGRKISGPTTTTLQPDVSPESEITATGTPATAMTFFENGDQNGSCRYPTSTDAIVVGTCSFTNQQTGYTGRGWFVGLSDAESDARQSDYGNVCTRPVTDFLTDFPTDFRTAE